MRSRIRRVMVAIAIGLMIVATVVWLEWRNAKPDVKMLIAMESEQLEYVFEIEQPCRGANYYILALWSKGSIPEQHDDCVPLIEVTSVTGYLRDELTIVGGKMPWHADATRVCLFSAYQGPPVEVGIRVNREALRHGLVGIAVSQSVIELKEWQIRRSLSRMMVGFSAAIAVVLLAVSALIPGTSAREAGCPECGRNRAEDEQ